jgi:hypothetical protein
VMRFLAYPSVVLMAAVVLASAPIPIQSACSAGTFTFSTGSGATNALGDPVSATVTLTTNANGTISISLQNTIVNQANVGQNVSDLFFNVSNLSTASITSSSSTLRNVAPNGTFTDANSPTTTGWALTTSGSTIHLNGLAGATYAPSHTLIGEPDPTANPPAYTNANNSITGNGPHNPFLTNPTTFTVTASGVNADTVISDVIFSFGTTAGDNVPGGPNPNIGTVVPEPASLLLLGLGGMVGLGAIGLKGRRNKTVVA